MKIAPSFCSFIKKLYLCSKMSCTSMQITQVCRNQNSCQLITSFLNFPHKLFILSGLWDYSKYSHYFGIYAILGLRFSQWRHMSLAWILSYTAGMWLSSSLPTRDSWFSREHCLILPARGGSTGDLRFAHPSGVAGASHLRGHGWPRVSAGTSARLWKDTSLIEVKLRKCGR